MLSQDSQSAPAGGRVPARAFLSRGGGGAAAAVGTPARAGCCTVTSLVTLSLISRHGVTSSSHPSNQLPPASVNRRQLRQQMYSKGMSSLVAPFLSHQWPNIISSELPPRDGPRPVQLFEFSRAVPTEMCYDGQHGGDAGALPAGVADQVLGDVIHLGGEYE